MGPNCVGRGGDRVLASLRRAVQAGGLEGEVRVTASGCLSQCDHGPNAVVYPDATWYCHLDAAKAERIAREHLTGGRPVEEYLNPIFHGDDLEFEDPFR
jgi:(2Fe-2S) ferredoxin